MKAAVMLSKTIMNFADSWNQTLSQKCTQVVSCYFANCKTISNARKLHIIDILVVIYCDV